MKYIQTENIPQCNHNWKVLSESHDSTHDAELKKCKKCKIYWNSVGSVYGNSEDFYYDKKEIRKFKLEKINEL